MQVDTHRSRRQRAIWYRKKPEREASKDLQKKIAVALKNEIITQNEDLLDWGLHSDWNDKLLARPEQDSIEARRQLPRRPFRARYIVDIIRSLKGQPRSSLR